MSGVDDDGQSEGRPASGSTRDGQHTSAPYRVGQQSVGQQSAGQQSELFAGAILAAKYRLIAEIGRGGMGSVWRAERLGWDAPVAVKLMSAEIADRPEALARFEREVRLAAGLRSPHVVQVLDHGLDAASGTPFIVMELLEGESLARRLKRSGRLSPGETFGIISDVVRALGRAHAAGIVHRDLKPDNIFLVRNEDEGLAKILDFGVAKWTAPSLPESGLTRPGSVVGTPFYMSPEQIQGSQNTDHRADLWSLATIVCECLTGRRPFEAPDFAQLAVMLLGHGARPLPSSLGPVPSGFDAWFARATTSDIKQRFQTARELAQTLAPLCGASASGLQPDSFRATEELWVGGDAHSTAAVSHTSPRLSAPARLWRSPLARLVSTSLVSFVLIGGGAAFWLQRSRSTPAAVRDTDGSSTSSVAASQARPQSTSNALTPLPPPPVTAHGSSPGVRLVVGATDPAEPPPAAERTGSHAERTGSPPAADFENETRFGALRDEQEPTTLSARQRDTAKAKARVQKSKRAAGTSSRRAARLEVATPEQARRAAVPADSNTGSNAAPSPSPPASVDVNGRRIRTSLGSSP
jgi:serine/threonine protein kinase